jgi:AraC-like DNA-binding protein
LKSLMLAQDSDTASLKFSTAALPVRERVPFWREVFGRKLVRIDVEPLANVPLKAAATLRALPGLRTMSCTSTAARTKRTRELVADGDDDFALLINMGGTMTASQLGREVTLRPGDAALFLHAEPATMTHGLFQHEGLVMSRAAVASMMTNAEDMAMRLIPRGNEALRLLTGYLAIVHDGAATTLAIRHLTATHVHDLAALAIGASRDGAATANERGMRAARLAAIKADVMAHVADRGLTLATLAVRHGISPRSVQLLFESEGLTFSQFVLEQRLARAYRMLTDPRHAVLTVSAIALAAGFGDLSHFNRNFRRRYGATPSDVRDAALRA